MLKLRSVFLSFVLVALMAAVIAPSWARPRQDPTTFTITGDIPAPLTLGIPDLDKLPQQTTPIQEEDGTTTQYTGVLLRLVMEKAGAPTGKALRGKALASYLVASARDGYQVVFTLGELDPAFGNEQVLLVYKREGKPLFGYQGPFRIVCPADKAGARSLRMLSSIQFVKLRK